MDAGQTTSKKDGMTGRTSSIPSKLTSRLNELRKQKDREASSRNMESNQSRNSNTDGPVERKRKRTAAGRKADAIQAKKDQLAKLKKEKRDNQRCYY